jgi:hypothetical protein
MHGRVQGTYRRRHLLPTANDCFALDAGNRVLTSTDARAGQRSHWAHEQLPGAAQGRAIDCPTRSLCVTLASDGVIITSTDPLAGASAKWQRLSVDTASERFELDALSCVGRTLCMAVGSYAEVPGLGPTEEVAVSSTDPGAGASAKWSISGTFSVEGQLLGVSCASSSLCVAVDPQQADSTVDPTKGSSATWTSGSILPPSVGDTFIDAVSCPSVTLCVAVGEASSSRNLPAVLTTRDPAEPAKARWHQGTVKRDGTVFDAVSCGSVSFCAAVGDRAAITTAPTTPSSWVAAARVDGASVSCATASTCAAVDQQGYFFLATLHRPKHGDKFDQPVSG